MGESLHRHWSGLGLSGVSLLALALATACGSSIDSNGNGPSGPSGSGGSASNPGGGTGGGPILDAQIDPGRVAIHRLNNTEYDNTVRDLLGTQSKPAATFLAEEGLNFDNT